MDKCMLCGANYPEMHHVMHGTADRKLATKYGLVVPLCYEHHRGNTGVHFNRDLDIRLKKLAQKYMDEQEPGLFFKVFGKNYL